MSDRRAKYIILAAIVFAGIVGVSQGQGLFDLTDAKPITTTSSLGYLGHVTAIVKDSDGNIKSYHQVDNILMDGGRNCGIDLVFPITSVPITGSFNPTTCRVVGFIAIGSSDTSPDPRQTNLDDKTENGNAAATLTGVIAAGVGGDESPRLILENTFTILAADSGETIAEAALFDSSTEGLANMFARTLIGPFPVNTDDLVTVKWNLDID